MLSISLGACVALLGAFVLGYVLIRRRSLATPKGVKELPGPKGNLGTNFLLEHASQRIVPPTTTAAVSQELNGLQSR